MVDVEILNPFRRHVPKHSERCYGAEAGTSHNGRCDSVSYVTDWKSHAAGRGSRLPIPTVDEEDDWTG